MKKKKITLIFFFVFCISYQKWLLKYLTVILILSLVVSLFASVAYPKFLKNRIYSFPSPPLVPLIFHSKYKCKFCLILYCCKISEKWPSPFHTFLFPLFFIWSKFCLIFFIIEKTIFKLFQWGKLISH